MIDVEAQRAAVLTEALSWRGTPFHDDARIKGVGVDCAQFVAACYLESSVVPPFDIPRYTAQWFMHRSEERLMDFVLRFGHEVDEAQAKSADLVLYKIGRAYAHAAIIIEWPKMIIHAHKLSKKVIEQRPFDFDLFGLPVKFFSLW